MVPRTEIHALEVHASFAEVAKSFVESGFSRIPVYEGELDKMIGILYNKDVFKAFQEKSEFRIRDHLHPAYFVPSTLPISELLKQMQRRRLAMALNPRSKPCAVSRGNEENNTRRAHAFGGAFIRPSTQLTRRQD